MGQTEFDRFMQGAKRAKEHEMTYAGTKTAEHTYSIKDDIKSNDKQNKSQGREKSSIGDRGLTGKASQHIGPDKKNIFTPGKKTGIDQYSAAKNDLKKQLKQTITKTKAMGKKRDLTNVVQKFSSSLSKSGALKGLTQKLSYTNPVTMAVKAASTVVMAVARKTKEARETAIQRG